MINYHIARAGILKSLTTLELTCQLNKYSDSWYLHGYTEKKTYLSNLSNRLENTFPKVIFRFFLNVHAHLA